MVIQRPYEAMPRNNLNRKAKRIHQWVNRRVLVREDQSTLQIISA